VPKDVIRPHQELLSNIKDANGLQIALHGEDNNNPHMNESLSDINDAVMACRLPSQHPLHERVTVLILKSPLTWL